jgi:hypothetical protein
MIDDDCGEIGGLKIYRGNHSTQRKPCPSATLSTTNLTWLDLDLNLGPLRWEFIYNLIWVITTIRIWYSSYSQSVIFIWGEVGNIQGYSMGHIWRNLKKKFFFLRFCMDVYYKASMGRILEKIKNFFFWVSVWTYTIRL